MNIYELEKQATPGPWCTGDDPSTVYAKYSHADHAVVARTYCWEGHGFLEKRKPGELKKIRSDGAQANAILLAHCRNNYMKALEALKSIDCSTSTDRHAQEKHEALIAELEEVK